MPTYKITGPDGKVYRVTGEGSADEAMAQVRAQVEGAAPPQPPVAPEAPPIAPEAAPQPAPPAEEPGLLRKALTGLENTGLSAAKGLTSTARFMAGDYLSKPFEMLGEYAKSKGFPISPTDEQMARSNQAVEEGGLVSQGAKFAGDVALGLAPGSSVQKGAQAVGQVLKQAGQRTLAPVAKLATDMLGNAGVSAALAPEDKGEAAAWGAGGSAAGNLVARTLGGPLRKSITPEAKKLIDAGIKITPGQAISGSDAGTIARVLRATEDKSTSLPLVGDIIKNAQNKSVESFNLHKINEAIAKTGKKVKTAGLAGLEEAEQHVSDLYDANLPNIKMQVPKARAEITNGVNKALQDPLFDDQHRKLISQYIERRLDPLFFNNTQLDGDVFKKIDSELGEKMRDFNKGGPMNKPLGNAFAELRKAWRNAAEGATPEARQAIRDADEAFAKLLPLEEAGARTNIGIFTPKQLASQLRSQKLKPDEITQAARYVLPSSVPDSGTAGRFTAGSLMTPQAAGAGTALAATGMGIKPLAVGAGLASLLYTKPGLKAATQGVHPAVKALRRKFGKGEIDPDELEAFVSNITGRGVTAAGTE